MREVWRGRLAQAGAKYGEHAPMVTTCCNACRTCVTTNVLTILTGAAAGAGAVVAHAARGLAIRHRAP